MKRIWLRLEFIFYIFGPALAAALVSRYIVPLTSIKIASISADIEANAASAVMGYGFAAVFFLLALPRSGFLRRIDQSGKLISYALTIGMSSILAIVHLGMTAVSKYDPQSDLFTWSQVIFLATTFHFVWSLAVLFLLLYQYRTNASDSPRKKSFQIKRSSVGAKPSV